MRETSIKIDNYQKESVFLRVMGWIGTFFIILAYTLNSFGYVQVTDISYPVMNLIGAVAAGIRIYYKKNWSNLFLEFFWGAVAIISIIRHFI